MATKSRDEVKAAVLKRLQSLESLAAFAENYLNVIPALHHKVMCDAVDDLWRNDRYDVLLIMSPPASAKSTYISMAAPAYMMAIDPTIRIISVSRAAELATEFGKRVRSIVSSDEFRSLAPATQLDQSSRAADNWKTTKNGSYFAVGASGGVLGRRADMIICDDIHASFEDAQSETQLEKLRSWFQGDLLSRRNPANPKGKLIMIGQRLNPNDMIGFMMRFAEENPTLRVKILRFSAECDDPTSDPLNRQLGDRMWPEFYTDDYLATFKADPFIWKTLWMQSPPSDSGSWVAPEEIRILEHDDPDLPEPSQLHHYILSDLALSVNSGDYSVHLVVGVDSTRSIFVVDAWRDRTSPEVTARKHLDLTITYKPQESLIDDDNAAKVYVHLLATEAQQRGQNVPWKMLPMRGQDKETRAAALRGLFKRGKVFLKRAEWNRWLVRELLIFPNAMGQGVDDAVDALSLIGRRLGQLAAPAGAAPPPQKVKTWQDATLNEMWEQNELKRGFGAGRV
jgi:predicted phage terminase large subunit-like protein